MLALVTDRLPSDFHIRRLRVRVPADMESGSEHLL